MPVTQTSRDAADSIIGKAAAMRHRILAYIRSRGDKGATDCEISAVLGMQMSTVNPRRGELVKAGFVVGTIETRLTPSGCHAIVWIATDRIGDGMFGPRARPKRKSRKQLEAEIAEARGLLNQAASYTANSGTDLYKRIAGFLGGEVAI